MSDHRAPDAGGSPAPGPVEPGAPLPVDTGSTALPAPALAADQPLAPELTEVNPKIMDGTDNRPEPVLDAAKIAGAISLMILAIGGLLKLLGVVVPTDYDLQALADQAGNAILAIFTAWTVVGPWILARVKARDKVTPLADPRDAAGRSLVPTKT